MDGEDFSHQYIREALEKHRNDAESEFTHYVTSTELCRANPSNRIVHGTFDFAENVLLPLYRKQLGCLYFVTGLKLHSIVILNQEIKLECLSILPVKVMFMKNT